MTSEDTIESKCNCAGVILIRLGDPRVPDDLQVLLVQGHWRSYPFSFPKGKRKKGEDPLVAAKRELYEETGIEDKHYILFPRTKYIEYRTDTDPHKPHIVYYFAILKCNDTPINPIDVKEVMAADWYTPKQIYQMKRTIYLQRQQIVTKMVKDFTFCMKNSYQRSYESVDNSLQVPLQ